MKQLSLIFLCTLILSACGDKDAYIADKVKFKVIFSQRIVQVSFEINDQYKIKTSKRVSFGELGTVFLKYTDTTNISEIGSQLKGDLSQGGWPSTVLAGFPNGKDLPPSVPAGAINQWSIPDSKTTFSLLFDHKPNLVGGGNLLNEQFNSLPKSFLATQKFYAANHDVQASITVVGPTSKVSGGIFFFSNFGINPFLSNNLKDLELTGANIPRPNPDQDVVEWEIKATEPASIETTGNLNFNLWWSFTHLLSTLENDINQYPL